jgi:hypothetical protein
MVRRRVAGGGGEREREKRERKGERPTEARITASYEFPPKYSQENDNEAGRGARAWDNEEGR